MPFIYAFRIPILKIRRILDGDVNSAMQQHHWWLVKVGMTMGDDDEAGMHDLFRRFYNIGDGVQRFFNCAVDVPQLSRGGNTTPVKGRSLSGANGAGLAPFQSLHEFIERQRRKHWNKSDITNFRNGNVTPFRRDLRGGAYEDLVFVLPLPSAMGKIEVVAIEGFVRLAMGGIIRRLDLPLSKSYKRIPDNLNYNEMIIMQSEYAEEIQEWFRSGHLDIQSFMEMYGESATRASFLKEEFIFELYYDDEKMVANAETDENENANFVTPLKLVNVRRSVLAHVAYPI